LSFETAEGKGNTNASEETGFPISCEKEKRGVNYTRGKSIFAFGAWPGLSEKRRGKMPKNNARRGSRG